LLNTHPETAHGSAFIDPSDPHLSPVARTRSRVDNYAHALARFQELGARLPAATSPTRLRGAPYPHLGKPM
jgi:hypothetical protein